MNSPYKRYSINYNPEYSSGITQNFWKSNWSRIKQKDQSWKLKAQRLVTKWNR